MNKKHNKLKDQLEALAKIAELEAKLNYANGALKELEVERNVAEARLESERAAVRRIMAERDEAIKLGKEVVDAKKFVEKTTS